MVEQPGVVPIFQIRRHSFDVVAPLAIRLALEQPANVPFQRRRLRRLDRGNGGGDPALETGLAQESAR